MLLITIPDQECFDEVKSVFTITKGATLQLEHSLISLSKWESKWKKPFLTDAHKPFDETADYVRCMTLTPNVDPEVYNFLTSENVDEINAYISDPMTATTFSKDDNRPPNKEIITSEIIYYSMVAYNIPFECQKWHLNRLLTLINVCNIKNQPTKKMSRAEIIARNRALNNSRRAKLNTNG